MEQTALLQGHKGGAAKQHTPYEEKNNLLSKSIAKVLLAIGEGEFAGNPTPENIYLDGTPLVSAGGLENFGGVTWEYRTGRSDQTYIKGMPDVSNEFAVALELTSDKPWTRFISDSQLDAVRVTLAWPSLQESKDNGDIVGYNIEYAIDLSTDGGPFVEYGKYDTNNGKTNVEYDRTHRVTLTRPGTSWTIRVRRITANRHNAKFADTMTVKSFAEVIDAKLRYPNTALLYVEFDAETFGGSSIPKVSVKTKGRIIQVPNNYDPVSRTYTGVWNGTFKWAWTDNPAWVFFDLVTNERFGLGARIKPEMVDKWTLYQVAQYCDVLVPDGKGGQEPRYTCNIYIQARKEAWQVLRDIVGIFNGMLHWSGTQIVASADMPVAVNTVRTYHRGNVIDGKFSYGSTSEKTISTTALVSFDDPENHYETAVEAVNDLALVQRYKTWNQAEIAAIGVTSRGQAQRKGKYQMLTNSLNRVVTFNLGMEGYLPRPGEVFGVADQVLAGSGFSGRISAATIKTVTCDREPNAAAGDILYVNKADGSTAEGRTIQSVNGKVITVTTNYSAIPEVELGWYVEKTTLKSQLFRATKVTWNDNDGKFEVTGVQYEDSKYNAIDKGARLESRPITNIPAGGQEPPTGLQLSAYTFTEQQMAVTTLSVSWLRVAGAMNYEAQWRKDGGDWNNVGRTASTGFEVKGIYKGAYQARVRALNVYGTASVWVTSDNTDLNGKEGAPPVIASLTTESLLFGIALKWSFPNGAEDTSRTELWYSTSPDLTTATKLADLAYPQADYTMQGLRAGQQFWFWARLVDKSDNIGEFFPNQYGVVGQASSDAGAILDQIADSISKSELGKELLGDINRITDDSPGSVNDRINQAKETLNQSITDVANQVGQIENDLDTSVGQLQTDLSSLNTALTNQISSAKSDLQTAINAVDARNVLQWKSNLTYTTGQMVQYTNGRIYRAKQNVPVNQVPTNTTYWLDIGSIVTTVDALTTRVSTAEQSITNVDGKVTAQSTRIDGVQSQVNGKADATALNNLTTRVSTAEGKIDSQATAITGLQTKVDGKADASALSSLTNRVTAVEGNVTSQSENITSLNNSLFRSMDNSPTKVYQSVFNNMAADKWVSVNSTGSAKAYYGTADGSTTPGVLIMDGGTNGSWWAESTRRIRFDPTRTYKLSARVKQVSVNGTTTPATYLGLNCFAEDGVVRINNSGADSVASQHYVLANGAKYTVAQDWVEVSVYVKGHTVGSEGGGSGAGTIADPKRLKTGTAWISPMVISGYSSIGGVAALDYFVIEDATEQLQIDANASATSALTTRVTNAEGSITSQGSSITNLSNSLSLLGNSGINLLPAEYSVFGAEPPVLRANSSTYTTEADTATFKGYALKTSWTTATGQGIILAKDFELSSCNMAVQKQKFVVSFWAKASVAGHVIGGYLRLYQSDNTTTWTSGAPTVTIGTAWARYSMVMDLTVSAVTGNQMALVIQTNRSAVANRTLWLDRIMVEPVVNGITEPSAFSVGDSFDATRANSSATQALTTRVSKAEDSVTSQGQAITSLTNTVAGKADSSAVQSLTSRVDSVAGTVTSQGQSITSLNDSLPSSGGENLLINPSFEIEGSTSGLADGWRIGSPLAAASRLTSLVTSTLDPRGKAQRVDCKGLSGSGYVDLALPNASWISMAPGQIITVSGYVRGTPGLVFEFYLQYKNSASSTITTHGPLRVTMTEDWNRIAFTGTAAPAGTVAVDPLYRIRGPLSGTATDGYYEVDRAQAEFAPTVSGWKDNTITVKAATAANASATSALTNRVSSAEGTITSQGSSITNLNNVIDPLNSAVNLIPAEYSSFGDTPPAMNKQGGLVVTTEADNLAVGNYKLKIENTVASQVGYFYLATGGGDWTMKVKPGKKYILSFWMQADAARVMSLRIRYPNSAGTIVETELALLTTPTTWTRVSAVMTMPAALVDSASIVFYQNKTAQLSTHYYDGFMFEEQIGSGTAPSTFSVGNSARQVQGQASAMSALTTRVLAAEGSLTSQSSQITELNNSLGDVGGENLLYNPIFRAGTGSLPVDGWIDEGNATSVNTTPASWMNSGENQITMTLSGLTSSIYKSLRNDSAKRFKVAAGQTYTASIYVKSNINMFCRLYYQFLNSAGTVISSPSSGNVAINSTASRVTLTASAPNGAVDAYIYYRLFGPSSTAVSAVVEFARPQVETGPIATGWSDNGQLSKSDIAATSSALSALTSTVTNQGKDITSQSQSITSLNNSLTAISGTGTNLLSDEYSWLTSTALPTVVNSTATSSGVAVPESASGFGYKMKSSSTSNGAFVMLCPSNNAAGYNIPVEPGYYLVSFYASAPSTGSVRVRMFASGVSVYSATQAITSTRTRYSLLVNMGTTSATVAVIFYFNMNSVNGQEVTIDSVMVEKQVGNGTTASPFVAGPSARSITATASALSNLTNRVTNAEGSIASQSGSITSLTNSLSGKADASALAALTNRVANTEGNVSSQSSAITDLQNSIGTAGSFDVAPGNSWNFDGSTEGWETNAANMVVGSGFIRLSATGIDPQFMSPSAYTTFNGALYTIIRAKITRRGGTTADWDGLCFYSTASHGFASGYYKRVANPNLAVGQSAIIEWDMSALDAGGNDWTANTIQRIRLDFGNTTGSVFDIDWVAVGRQGPSASARAVSSLETTVTQQGTNISAQATQISGLQTTVGNQATSIQQVSNIANGTNNAINASYSVKLMTMTNGTKVAAGFGLGLGTENGVTQSSFVVSADRFSVINSSLSGQITSPFSVVGGVTYLADAFVRNASITNAKIGGVIQSDAVDGYGRPLWSINKSGGMELNSTNSQYRRDMRANYDRYWYLPTGVLVIEIGELS